MVPNHAADSDSAAPICASSRKTSSSRAVRRPARPRGPDQFRPFPRASPPAPDAGATTRCRRGAPTAAPRAPRGPATARVACSADRRAAPSRTTPRPPTLPSSAPGNCRTTASIRPSPPVRRPTSRSHRPTPPRRHRHRGSVGRYPRSARIRSPAHPPCAAHRRTRASVSGRPPGASAMTCAAPPSLRAASTACASGSAIMIMPGPPPYGRSSTVRCASAVKSRGFHVVSDHSPSSYARRVIPCSVIAANIAGKSVTTSKRITNPSASRPVPAVAAGSTACTYCSISGINSRGPPCRRPLRATARPGSRSARPPSPGLPLGPDDAAAEQVCPVELAFCRRRKLGARNRELSSLAGIGRFLRVAAGPLDQPQQSVPPASFRHNGLRRAVPAQPPSFGRCSSTDPSFAYGRYAPNLGTP